MMESRYRIAKTRDEVLQVIDYCKTTGYASIDFETTGNNPRKLDFYPTIVGISFQVGSGWIIPLGHFDSPFKNNWRDILALIGEELWENPAIVKMAWNATFESKVFIHYGYHLRGRLLDGLLAKYLLNEERPHGLKETVDRFLPDFSGYGLETGLGKKASDEAVFNYWSTVPLEELSKYCALDTDTTFRLTLDFENKLIIHDLYRLYRNLYMPLVRVFAESTYWGVNIDREYLEWLQGHFKKKIEELEDEVLDLPTVHSFNEVYVEEKIEAYIEELQEEIDYGDLSDRQISAREEKISRIEAGEATTKKEQKLLENINLGSPKQLIELLYTHEEGYQFPILERSETGNPSTSESTLLKLLKYDDEGFINKLLEYRGFKKLFSTYVESILTDHLTHEDRIHPSFLLFGTVTSRLSSRNPNLQNIPRGTTNNLIKPMFIPEHPDHLYLEVDGSQMELRVAAELSKDENMIRIFKEGKNIHVQTAALMFELPYDSIQKARKDPNHPEHETMTKKHKSAKILNFTIFYGAGPKKVSEFLTERTGEYHSVEEAKEMIESWFKAFPGAKKWIDRTQKYAKKHGYVKNMFGFKRRLPILLRDPRVLPSSERGSYNEALRQSVNSIIQGSASMITLWVLLVAYEYSLTGKLPRYLRMVTEVHDSIEYHPHKADAKKVIETLQQIARDLPQMEDYLGATLHRVPMKFSAEIGINWGRMVEADLVKDFEKFYEEEWLKYNKEPYPHINFLSGN